VIYSGATILTYMGESSDAAVFEAITIGIVNFVFAVNRGAAAGLGRTQAAADRRLRRHDPLGQLARLVLLR
jgi:hypothetical protein